LLIPDCFEPQQNRTGQACGKRCIRSQTSHRELC
jgi:hypothetical protein